MKTQNCPHPRPSPILPSTAGGRGEPGRPKTQDPRLRPGVPGAPKTQDPPPVFSLDEALSKCLGQHDLFQEIAGCLLCEADPLLEKMSVSLDSGDAVELANAAHRLKGTVAYLAPRPHWPRRSVSRTSAAPATWRPRRPPSEKLAIELGRLTEALAGQRS